MSRLAPAEGAGATQHVTAGRRSSSFMSSDQLSETHVIAESFAAVGTLICIVVTEHSCCFCALSFLSASVVCSGLHTYFGHQIRLASRSCLVAVIRLVAGPAVPTLALARLA